MNLATKSQFGGRPGTRNAANDFCREPGLEGPRSSVRRARDPRVLAALESACPAERKEAAETLGRRENKREKIEFFSPLVLALQKEKDEDVQGAILIALRMIGEASHPEEERIKLNFGYGPLFQFMLDNIAKPKLIGLALDAFGYTGTIDAVLSGNDAVQKLAESLNHTESAKFSHRFYMNIVCAH